MREREKKISAIGGALETLNQSMKLGCAWVRPQNFLETSPSQALGAKQTPDNGSSGKDVWDVSW